MRARPYHPESDNAALMSWVEKDPHMLENMGYDPKYKVTPNDISLFMWNAHISPFKHPISIDSGDELAGIGIVENISPADGSAGGHIVVSPKYRGKGYWIEREAMRYARRILGVASIIAVIEPENTLSVKFHERMGFKKVESVVMVRSLEDMEE